MDVAGIATSGLLAGATRLATSASNLANAQSDGALPDADGPVVYQAQRVDQRSLGGGGTIATVGSAGPSYSRTYDASASYADGSGMVATPNVDPVTELARQSSGLAEFRFSAKALTASDTMMKSLLDMKA